MKLFSLLEDLSIPTETIEHPEAFTVDALMPHLAHSSGAAAKNLFVCDKKKRLWLISCQHDRKLNLNDVARQLGTKNLRFADESVMLEKLGVGQGSVTAYALMEDSKRKEVAFAVDEAFVDGSHERVFFHPMINTASTAIGTEDFKTFLRAVGRLEDPNLKPWASITGVLFINPQHLLTCLEADYDTFISEKLDGSNVSVDSEGTIASRRCTLLKNPSEEEFEKYKFSGASLQLLSTTLSACVAMRDELFRNIMPGGAKPVVTVYGELILEGTAQTKKDKFNYRARGYERGQLAAFGLAISFEEAENAPSTELVNEALIKAGFVTSARQGQSHNYCLCIMNQTMNDLFEKYGVPFIPVKAMKLRDCFLNYEPMMKKQFCEGYIITVPATGSIFKWKGVEESFGADRMEAIAKLKTELKDWPDVIGPLSRTVDFSLQVQDEETRMKRSEKNLKQAFGSAKSKYNGLKECLVKCKDYRSAEIEGERYLRLMKKEMLTDSDGDEDYLLGLDHFLKVKVTEEAEKIIKRNFKN